MSNTSTKAEVKRSSRSRRLRKKLFLDEFATQGFTLDFEFTNAKENGEQLDDFIDEMMEGAIKPNGLIFIGSACSDTFAGVVICEERYAAVTAEQRQLVIDWLAKNSAVKNVEAGELTDANELL